MNDRADFQQQQDMEQREAQAMQALMEIASAGLTDQADILAAECGLLSRWKSPVRVKRTYPGRSDGKPF